MEEKGNNQKSTWRLVFIAADVIILLALLIGFGLMHSKNSRSSAALTDEIGSVREQLSSIATDQEAISESLASLQESVATAELGEEVKTELSSLKASYDGISGKVDCIVSKLDQTEAQAALQEDVATIRSQNESNKETIDSIRKAVSSRSRSTRSNPKRKLCRAV